MQQVYESSFGDVSSIMIMPDQIYNNNFNLLDDDENSPVKKKKWSRFPGRLVFW